MKSSILMALIGCLAVVACEAQEPTPNPAAFLARLSWSSIDLSPRGISENDCLLVLQDGHFHMEQRLQQLPLPRASLYIHDSLLSDSQLEQLQNIISQPAIANLPKFAPFPIPVGVRAKWGFVADISRSHQIEQKAGYMEWQPSRPDQAYGPDAKSLVGSQALAKSQEPAKKALSPLLRWFLNLEAQQLHTPQSGKSTLCQE